MWLRAATIVGDETMKKLGIAAALVAAMCLAGATSASAQKLYWTASGQFGPFNIQGLIPTYPDARDIKIPINMWVLDHPQGFGRVRHGQQRRDLGR